MSTDGELDAIGTLEARESLYRRSVLDDFDILDRITARIESDGSRNFDETGTLQSPLSTDIHVVDSKLGHRPRGHERTTTANAVEPFLVGELTRNSGVETLVTGDGLVRARVVGTGRRCDAKTEIQNVVPSLVSRAVELQYLEKVQETVR